MNWMASDTIVAAKKSLTFSFFLEDTSAGVSERAFLAFANIIIINETSDKAIVTYSWGSAKNHDRKKMVHEAKSLGSSGLV